MHGFFAKFYVGWAFLHLGEVNTFVLVVCLGDFSVI
jgi:hypothetical protein